MSDNAGAFIIWGAALMAALAVGQEMQPSKTGEYSLIDFGDVSTPQAARDTVDKACRWIIERGGGILVIPSSVSVPLEIRNVYQKDRESGPTVTIRDLRKGYEVRHLPSVGQATPTGWYGEYLYRMINMEGHGLPFQGNHEILGLRNAIVRGASSYMQWTLEPVEKGADRRIYVPSIRGIFPGQYLTLCGNRWYGPPIDRIWVKAIGWDADKRMNYLVADLDNDHPKESIIYNKHVTGSVQINTSANCDNQTMELQVTRNQYARGDSFLISAAYVYQGDVFSGLGDECGVGLNSEICFDPDGFHGRVAGVEWADNALSIEPGMCNIQKLATSRPLINMNQAKWLTNGTVMIVPPDDWAGYIVANTNLDVRKLIEGGVPVAGFPFTYSAGGQERSSVTTWRGQPVKAFRYVYRNFAYPSLINDGINYLGGCIIGSPDCGWGPEVVGRYFAVADAGEYLSPSEQTAGGFYLGGSVTRDTYRWYEIKQFRRNADGTCVIRIERIRWAAVAAGAPNLYNRENYTWDGHERPLRYIIAPGAMVYDIGDAWRDTESGVSTGGVIRVAANGDRNTRFDFAAGDPIEQAIGADPAIPTPIRIRCFNGVPDTLEASGVTMLNWGKVAMASGLSIGGPEISVEQVANRKDRRPAWITGINIGTVTENGIIFGADVENAAISFEQPNMHAQPVKWRHAAGETVLTVDPATGDMAIEGGALAVSAAKGLRGISGSGVAANNLRQLNVAVPAGARRLDVKFEKPEPDAAYAVVVQPNWFAMDRVVKKTSAGFEVEFSEPAPKGATVDWLLIR